MSVQSFQELMHGEGFDYLEGSPHLKHSRLFRKLESSLQLALEMAETQGLPCTLLDIGAGDGSFDAMPLARSWSVTAVEESRPSIEVMRSRFDGNAKFEAVYDPEGTLSLLSGRRYSVVLIASVLHHIPDYLAALTNVVDNHLEPNGTLITFQDPLWYPDQPRLTTMIGNAAYFSWRVTKGGALQGMRNRLRRSRGIYDESNPADIVEYHVVRQGVDQHAIESLLVPRFESVAIEAYWSTQSQIWQQLGERAHLTNTFAIYASRLLPPKNAQ